MTKKAPLSHYSPKFANKPWRDSNGYTSYFTTQYDSRVRKSQKGWQQWGRERGIYSWEVETSLSVELENLTAPIYKKIQTYNEVTYDERIIWSQFLLSQLVRTPTFMKYEKKTCELSESIEKPKHDRVGCKKCKDLTFIANRNWCLLIADDDDYFIRTDNPILQTGFIELNKTCLFYPLSPKVCFVACSMPHSWDPLTYRPNPTVGYRLSKGGAHLYNFHLACAANKSLILSPEDDGIIAEHMYKDILGTYPQPPFPLHHLSSHTEAEEAFESIRIIMSKIDNVEYPKWQLKELEPFPSAT